EMYGDYSKWENIVGTGPYILTDFVAGSATTFTRNPNYWMNDPLNPENQLPYMDGINRLDIADLSTQQAAFRTGKLDILFNVSSEDFEIFLKMRPDLQYLEAWEQLPNMVTGRVDDPELPWYDVNVRRAMNMAVDQQRILDEYYEGHGTILAYPFLPDKSYGQWYKPLEEMPEAVQELFSYNPEKAKQLLADAGYPNGFQTKINLSFQQVDLISIVVADLAKVGIDVTMEPLETGNLMRIVKGRRHTDQLVMAMTYPHALWKMHNMRSESAGNPSFWESPQTREAYNNVLAALGKDDEALMNALQSVSAHVLEESWGIWLPARSIFNMWQPWIQNFNGEVNWGSSLGFTFRQYIWLDTELKDSLGY
ncbi:MAG: ABC transporter substrate-binding protein, partial [Dehalococcoidales bacterium]